MLLNRLPLRLRLQLQLQWRDHDLCRAMTSPERGSVGVMIAKQWDVGRGAAGKPRRL